MNYNRTKAPVKDANDNCLSSDSDDKLKYSKNKHFNSNHKLNSTKS